MVTEIQFFESTNTKVLWILIKKEELFTAKFYIIFKLMLKWQICYTEMTNFLQFAINVKHSHRQP